VNLNNKSYHIFNKEYSKEEYLEKKEELLKDLEKLKKESLGFYNSQVVKENLNINTENCS
jgi:hypothetical protein